MSKNRTYSSNIPKDALIFEVNGVKWERSKTYPTQNGWKCDLKNIETNEWRNEVPFNKIEKYLKL